jgi:hypothetical protein
MTYSNDLEADEIVRREAAKRGISETMYRMLRVADTSVIQDIVSDHVGKRDVMQPASLATPSDRAPPERGTGWVEPRPLTKQPGIDVIDQMVEAQTAKERIQAAQEQLRATLEMQKYEELMREKKERER